jgi:hypothetical protein
METDLYFFFTAGLGLRGIDYASLSCDSSIPIQPWFGSATYPDTQFRALFRDVRRYHRIAKKYQSMPLSTRRQLAAMCDPQYRYPPELIAVFGKKDKQGNVTNGRAGLALFCKADTLSQLIKICQKKEVKDEVERLYLSLKEQWNASF